MSKWSGLARTIRVPLGFVFAGFYFWLAKPTPISMLAGFAIVIPGLLVRAVASGHVQKNEQLATSGPYAHTRNPLYLGSLILATGFVLAARSWWIAFAIVIFFFLIYMPVIRSEERYLRERFSQYGDYADRVPLLLPRFTPYEGTPAQFSWDLYRRHREYHALIGAAVVAAALIGKWIWWK